MYVMISQLDHEFSIVVDTFHVVGGLSWRKRPTFLLFVLCNLDVGLRARWLLMQRKVVIVKERFLNCVLNFYLNVNGATGTAARS